MDERVEALEALAAVERRRSRFEEAMRWADLTIVEARRAGNALAEGEALNTRGLAAYSLGRTEAAVADLRASLAVHERAGHTLQQVIRLSNLGALRQLAAEYFAAQSSYERALKLLDANENEPWAAERRAVVVANLASLYQRLGRYERALDLYDSSAHASDLSDRERVQLLANLGALYRQLGDPYKAVGIYAEAATLALKLGDVSRQMSIGLNRGIALALDLHELAGAEEAFLEVLDVARRTGARRERLHARLYLGETRRRMDRLQNAFDDFQSAASDAQDLGLVEERWKALYGMGRIAEQRGDAAQAEALFRESIALVASLRASLEALALRRGFLADRSAPHQALLRLLLDSKGREGGCGTENFCEELISLVGAQQPEVLDRPAVSGPKVEALRDELRELWKRRLDAAPADRRDLDLRIERREAEYEELTAVEKRRRPATLAEMQRGLNSEEALLVLTITRDRLVRMWITRGTARYESTEVTDSSLRLLAEAASALAEADGEWRVLVDRAGKLLLGKAASIPELQASSRLLIVPALVPTPPIEILVAPGSSVTLLESHAVAYMPTLDALNRISPAWAWPWSKTFAAFANSSSEGSGNLPRLANAEGEAKAVARWMPGAGRTYVDSEATPDELRFVLAEAPPILHFAAHAIADGERPELSRLILSSSGGDPEPLMLAEIQRLPLAGVELATLSACETAQQSGGGDVRSLAGAFLEAGTASVVATRWRAPDAPTAALVEQFYYWIGRGEDRTEALRRAKLALAREPGTEHPYFWAGTVMLTRSAGPVVRPVPWPWVLVILGLTVALTALARRRT